MFTLKDRHDKELITCPDCRFSTDNLTDFDEHYYFAHITWQGECRVFSDGFEITTADDLRRVINERH